MRILLTNDDGFDAPGLAALYEAARMLPDTLIDVIAPAEVQSAKGHTVSGRFRCWPANDHRIKNLLVVEGSPADCVRAAMVLPDRPRPDWVISGINHGSNLGIDIYNSGTVAAAREAGILGVPALAVSQLVKQPFPDDWVRAAREAAAVIAAILMPESDCPEGADPEIHRQAREALLQTASDGKRGHLRAWWNVNLPRLADGQACQGVQLARISRDPPAMEYHFAPDRDGVLICENHGSYHARPAQPGTDVAVVFDGYVSISPLRWCDYEV
ncbi:MAG: hypothetical protein AMXMBFR13_23240 [Phycisphaerae bacterium]